MAKITLIGSLNYQKGWLIDEICFQRNVQDEITLAERADEALRELSQKKSDLIISNFSMAPGEYSADVEWDAQTDHFYDYNRVVCSLIRDVRKGAINGKTPLVVLVLDRENHPHYKEHVNEYMRAGATEVISLVGEIGERSRGEKVAQMLCKYLK